VVEEPAQSCLKEKLDAAADLVRAFVEHPVKGHPVSDHRAWDPVPDEVDHGKSAARELAGSDGSGLDEADPERAEDRGGSAECEPATPDSEEQQGAQRAVRPLKAWGPAVVADHPDEGARRSVVPVGV